MAEQQKILFVCLGNICRSPLAEGLMKHKLRSRGLNGEFKVDSCGTGSWHTGDLPDPRTMENAELNGIKLDHRARQLEDRDLEYFDHILAMDKSNLEDILSLPSAIKYRHKIKLLRDFDQNNKGADVPDPYFGEGDGFQKVYDIIDKCIEQWLNQNTR